MHPAVRIAIAQIRLADIRKGLVVSNSRFQKIRETIQDEVQRAGQEKKPLGTFQMNELVEKIRTKVRQHIKSTDRKWVGAAILRLVRIESANITRRLNLKNAMKREAASAQEKGPEVDQHDEAKSFYDEAMAYYNKAENFHDDAESSPSSSEAETHDHGPEKSPQVGRHAATPDLQQEGSSTKAGPKTPTTTQPCHESLQNNDNRVLDSVIIIHLEADLSEKVIFNLGLILTGTSDPNDRRRDSLYKASYEKLFQSLHADKFLTADSGDKLWGFVPKGPAPGWWRIRADFSLHACLHAQRACSDVGRFFYVINHGSLQSPLLHAYYYIAQIVTMLLLNFFFLLI